MKNRIWLLVLPLAFLLNSCGGSTPKYRVTTLPSGKQVKVLGVGNISFSKGEPALMLKYQTDLSIDDKDAIAREVTEIWGSFRADAEKGQFKNAIISVNEIPKGGFIKTNRTQNFVYQKSSDGNWQLL